MKKILFALLTLLFIFPLSPATAKEIGGVNLPDTLTAGNENLLLNGAGLRTKFFIKVYAGALYLKAKNSDAAAIINEDAPMAIRMQFIHDGVAAEKLITAWNEGFANAGNADSIKTEIATFNSWFTAEAKKGDVYDMIYTPGQGVRLYIKEKLMGTIAGPEFKKALFGIWLGEKPADDSLKKGMLGKE